MTKTIDILVDKISAKIESSISRYQLASKIVITHKDVRNKFILLLSKEDEILLKDRISGNVYFYDPKKPFENKEKIITFKVINAFNTHNNLSPCITSSNTIIRR